MRALGAFSADVPRVGITNDWRKIPGSRAASSENVLQSYASMPPAAALGHLQSTYGGLTKEEASSRLVEKGANLLSVKKPPKWWQLLPTIILNPFNILLGFARYYFCRYSSTSLEHLHPAHHHDRHLLRRTLLARASKHCRCDETPRESVDRGACTKTSRHLSS